jgi:hypothetical protein
MDALLILFVVVAAVAVIGGLFAGRSGRQGPEPRFDSTAHSGDNADDPPTVPPDPGTGRPGGPDPD